MGKKNNIKEVQNKMLEIAKYIDKICRANDIEYFVFYGSLIGAIRHEGFIPWDDDFDIAMTYPNIVKFEKAMQEDNNSKYFFQTPFTDKEYNRPFAKVRDSETTFIQKGNELSSMNQGVYIDVFLLIEYPKSKFGRILLKYNRAMAMKPYLNMIHNKWLDKYANFKLKMLGKEKMFKKYYNKIVKNQNKKADNYIDIFIETYAEWIYSKEMLEPISHKFEDTEFLIPKEYDEMLKMIYGDYMQMPSDDVIKKYQHDIIFTDLNKSYKKYLNKRPWCNNEK